MFKSFVKKFEETTGSIKESLLKKPTTTDSAASPNTTTPATTSTATTTTTTTTPITDNNTTTTTTAANTNSTDVNSSNNSNNSNNSSSGNNYYVDVFKGSVVQPVAAVTESIKDSIRKEADNIKEFTEKDFPVVLQTVTSLSNSVTNTVTSTVTNTVAQSTIHLPSVAQLKDSCQDVDLYNGSLLLRTYEIKLKQMRTNGVILAERAEEVDKKIGPLVRTGMTHAESWKRAHTELSHLDELNNMVESLTLTMESVISKIESLEIGLSIEIDNFLDNEMNKWRERKEAESTRYEAARKQELARMEEELAAAYNRHEREKAMKERAAQLEAERIARKKADEELQRKIQEDANIRSNLDKTIQQQLNDYKTSGIIPQTAAASQPQESISIEQVTIEDSKDELEKFLAPTPPQTPPIKSEQQQQTVVQPPSPPPQSLETDNNNNSVLQSPTSDIIVGRDSVQSLSPILISEKPSMESITDNTNE